jgi:ParB/RepB/Spo0J family partition protein
MTCWPNPYDAAILARMEDIAEIPVSEVGEKYGSLRLADPRAEDAMLQSMQRHGQLTPVVCAKHAGYELLDGFKRLRACRRLGRAALTAKVLEAPARVCKAAILQLNRLRPIRELEEALVLASLHREDGLTQTEIAVLLGRHKSWVSRRIALRERLCEEVLDDLRLGLLSATVGRALATLPRGTQPAIAAAVVKHRLSTREAGQLVAYLVSRPRWEQDCILASPWDVVAPTQPTPRFAQQLRALERCGRAVAQGVTRLRPGDAPQFTGLLRAARVAVEQAAAALQEVRP